MNLDQIEGNWKQLKGSAKTKWGELSDDELDEAEGDREKLEGMIQERYGKTKEEVRKEVDKFLAEFKSASES